jgi:predicted aldo/keto reductase-like oxidoreductase
MGKRIPRRPLGKTGLEVSVLGLGGFHQVEVGQDTVDAVVDLYLAAGGNYIETARSYGAGASEHKLGRALGDRRNDVILASKTGQRDAEGAWREVNESLEALGTDHLDILIYHCLTEDADVNALATPGGAVEAFRRAQEQGMVRYTAASTHWPLALLPAMERLRLDAVMYWVNYLVPCNYPELYHTVAPRARELGLGIIGMKPLGDGYLHRSVGPAFTYALAQEVDVLACGFNSPEMLAADIDAVCAWQPPEASQLEAILRDAPELGDYICRQCGRCRLEDADVMRVFELEGKFDQQMFDGRPTSAPDYALRQRLCYWFNNQERAMALYQPLAPAVEALLASDCALPTCPYGINVRRKLRLAHTKLTGNPEFPSGVYSF